MVAFIGGIGAWELLLVVAVILVIFGPERMPEMARKFASISHKVRIANRDFQREMYRNLDPDEIMKEDEDSPEPPITGKNQDTEE
ncbi:twin-arginine translocase TatA/TatE family subunit [bacterium]|nr:twin-arginine translocase TatA/TatE family subunit [bacterium]